MICYCGAERIKSERKYEGIYIWVCQNCESRMESNVE